MFNNINKDISRDYTHTLTHLGATDALTYCIHS